MLSYTKSTIVHGVLLQVHNVGVLLQGPPGIGKSELALALLERGHYFVADDMVHIIPTMFGLEGYCDTAYFAQLALRQIGLIDLSVHFGIEIILPSSPIQLVIQLQENNTIPPSCTNLAEQLTTWEQLSRSVPMLILALPTRIDPVIMIETMIKQYQCYSQRISYEAVYC